MNGSSMDRTQFALYACIVELCDPRMENGKICIGDQHVNFSHDAQEQRFRAGHSN